VSGLVAADKAAQSASSMSRHLKSREYGPVAVTRPYDDATVEKIVAGSNDSKGSLVKRKVIGRVFAAVAVGAMMTASFAGAANAHVVVPVHQQPPNSGSGGGPGPDGHDWRDHGAPPNIDRHCDRHGNWHNGDNDQGGHRDQRCHPW